MKESDYITISNLAKLRVAQHAIRSVLPGYGLSKYDWGQAVGIIQDAEDRLERRVDAMGIVGDT